MPCSKLKSHLMNVYAMGANSFSKQDVYIMEGHTNHLYIVYTSNLVIGMKISNWLIFLDFIF